MPLHLLGKKSWNVYNQDNIERVRRDEAAAEAREAAEEQAMQEADARRRMNLLRGEPVDPVQLSSKPSPGLPSQVGEEDRLGVNIKYADRDRKRKRLRGEDDTDRDMRYAKRMVEDRPSDDDDRRIARASKLDDNAQLVDHGGHINLFPEEARAASKVIRDSRDGDRRQTKKSHDVDLMRLSDAAGRHSGEHKSKPWYSSHGHRGGHDSDQFEQVKKDVWGNEDPARGARDQARMTADDPLAAMMKGVKQVRKVEAERKRWKNERQAELRALEEDDERRRRGRHHRQDKGRRKEHIGDEDDLNSFSLEADDHQDRDRRRHTHERRRRRRNGDRDYSRHRDGDGGRAFEPRAVQSYERQAIR